MFLRNRLSDLKKVIFNVIFNAFYASEMNMFIRRVLKRCSERGRGISALRVGCFGDRRMVLLRRGGGDCFSQTHGYLQQEARYVIGRWGWADQLGSSYDGYLQQEARYVIRRWGCGGP